LDNYKIAETETFSKKINSRKFNHLYEKIIIDVYPCNSMPFLMCGINPKFIY